MTHHPGTAVNALGLDRSDVPYALTTYLMSYNSDQFRRATQSPFLAHAAKGTLPKPIVAQWLANDHVYLQHYISFADQLLSLLRRTMPQEPTTSKEDQSIERRLANWLEYSVQNIQREENLFLEVADMYNLDVPWINSTTDGSTKSDGLRRFETLFSLTSRTQENAFIPWLEGAVLLWATEKVYYEAFSWASKQDAQDSPKAYEMDQDGGAMRKEFIPNWSNRDFLMVVETLERIINEGVGNAVNRDDARWKEVKMRAHAVWEALLAAEEAFWPYVDASMAVNGDTCYTSHIDEAALNSVRMEGGELLGQGRPPVSYASHVDCNH